MALELDVSVLSVGIRRRSSWRPGVLWSIACSPLIPIGFGDMHPVKVASSGGPVLGEGGMSGLDELEEMGECRHEFFIRSVSVSVDLWKM